MDCNQFKPAWWLRNPHLQTLWPVFCRKSITHLALERERLELPDGDFIDLDWVQSSVQRGPVVLLMHGLEGSIESHYSKGMLDAITKQGWRGVFMHFRGCSGEPNRLPRGYHSGDTGDVAYVTKIIQRRFPGEPIAAIGYSLGGNVLLKWLGETQGESPLHAAIAISVPFELDKAADRIQQGFSRLYHWYFIRCMRDRMVQKHELGILPLDPAVIEGSDNILSFDDNITAPLHGFVNAQDYYTVTSSRQFLGRIQRPTLILHAKDDPFMTEAVIPSQTELSPYVELEISESGGHVGFVAGTLPWKPRYWLEERIPAFLKNHLK